MNICFRYVYVRPTRPSESPVSTSVLDIGGVTGDLLEIKMNSYMVVSEYLRVVSYYPSKCCGNEDNLIHIQLLIFDPYLPTLDEQQRRGAERQFGVSLVL